MVENAIVTADDIAKSLARLDKHVDSISDLYDESTRHLKRVIVVMKRFCTYVASRENLNAIELWPRFSVWIRNNQTKASSYGVIHYTDYIMTHKDNICLKHPIKTWDTAFKRWGVTLPDSFKAKLQVLKKEASANTSQREVINLQHKNHQTKQMITHWDKMLDLLTLDSNEFIERGNQVVINHYCNERQWQIIRDLKPKNIQGHQLVTKAVMSLGRATGARGKDMLTATTGSFKVRNDGNSVLFTYYTEKNGHKIRVKRPVHVAIQLHNDPKLCCILHIAQTVAFQAHVLKMDPEYPFMLGVNFYRSKDPTTRFLTAYRKNVCLIQKTAVVAGVKDHQGKADIGKKKIHIFRSICNDIMVNGKVDKISRQAHCGWSVGVDDKFYTISDHAACASLTPAILAGGQPHHVWTSNINSVPTHVLNLLLPHLDSPIMVYFRKVLLIALAANLCATSFTKYFNDISRNSQFKTFQSSVLESLKRGPSLTSDQKAENVEIAKIKRQLVQVTATLNMERAENKRMKKLYGKSVGEIIEVESDDDDDDDDNINKVKTLTHAKEKLLQITTEIAKNSLFDKKSMEFLSMVHDRVVNDVVPLVTKFSTHDNFVFGLSTTPGKRLLNCVLLGALYHNENILFLKDICDGFSTRQTWLGFVGANKKTSPYFTRFHTDGWSSFLISSALDRPVSAQEIAL